MSHNPTRRAATTIQKRQWFLQHLWSVLTGNRSRTRLRSQRLGLVESLEERRVLATMYAVDDANQLLTFDSATPGTISNNVAISGLIAGEQVVGIDTRPATGQLYALGMVDDGATRTGRIYTLNPTSGVASQVGVAPWSATLADTQFVGFNFNRDFYFYDSNFLCFGSDDCDDYAAARVALAEERQRQYQIA